jgi:hypothetical protein
VKRMDRRAAERIGGGWRKRVMDQRWMAEEVSHV